LRICTVSFRVLRKYKNFILQKQRMWLVSFRVFWITQGSNLLEDVRNSENFAKAHSLTPRIPWICKDSICIFGMKIFFLRLRVCLWNRTSCSQQIYGMNRKPCEFFWWKKTEVKNLMRVYLNSIYYAKFRPSHIFASIVRNGCGGFWYMMKLHMVYLTWAVRNMSRIYKVKVTKSELVFCVRKWKNPFRVALNQRRHLAIGRGSSWAPHVEHFHCQLHTIVVPQVYIQVISWSGSIGG
jgi:hypothetical protein